MESAYRTPYEKFVRQSIDTEREKLDSLYNEFARANPVGKQVLKRRIDETIQNIQLLQKDLEKFGHGLHWLREPSKNRDEKSEHLGKIEEKQEAAPVAKPAPTAPGPAVGARPQIGTPVGSRPQVGAPRPQVGTPVGARPQIGTPAGAPKVGTPVQPQTQPQQSGTRPQIGTPVSAKPQVGTPRPQIGTPVARPRIGTPINQAEEKKEEEKSSDS